MRSVSGRVEVGVPRRVFASLNKPGHLSGFAEIVHRAANGVQGCPFDVARGHIAGGVSTMYYSTSLSMGVGIGLPHARSLPDAVGLVAS